MTWPRWSALLLVCGPLALAQQPVYPPLQLAWQLEAEFGFYATPTVAGGLVYAGSRDNHLYAVDARSGEVRWQRDLGGRVYGQPVIADGIVYATADNGMVAALDAGSGAERWTQQVGTVIYAGAVVSGETVIVGMGDSGLVVGLNRADGSPRWQYQCEGRIGSAITEHQGRLYVPSYDRRLHVLDAATGDAIWQFPADGIVDSKPLVEGETVYLKLPDDTVYALALADGKERWRYTPEAAAAPVDQTSNWSPMVVRDGVLYFGSSDGHLYGLDTATGRRRLAIPRSAPVAAPPLTIGPFGFLGGKDGTVATVLLETGKVISTWTPAAVQEPALLSGIMWPPALGAGMLYVASLDGHLYAFRGADDPNAWRVEAQRELALAELLAGERPVTVVAEQAPEQYKVRFRLAPDGEWPRGARAGIAFDVDTAHSGYVLLAEPNRLRLIRHRGPDQDQVLAESAAALGAGSTITVQRDRHAIRVLTDDRERLVVGDEQFAPGRVLVGSAAAAVRLEAVQLQPTETVWFTDDFMRAGEARGSWRTLSGTWTASGVSQEDGFGDKQPDATKSSNPFAYRATETRDGALATTGYWFWDRYRTRAAVRAKGSGLVGLAGYLRDDKTYLAFEWQAAGGGGGERRLVAVVDGQKTVLAKNDGGWQQDQWYEIALELTGGVVEAEIDGRVAVRAQTDLLGQGEVGLLAEQVEFADFDDVSIVGSEDLVETFSAERAGRWRAVAGNWRLEADNPGERDPGVVANHGAPGLLVGGNAAWRNVRVGTTAKVATGAGAGLVAGYRDERNYVALRWGGRGAPAPWRDKLQLIRVRDGAEEVLVQRDGAPPAGEWHRLNLTVEDGWIGAAIGGQRILEAFDPSLSAGLAGLLAAGERVIFDGVTVEEILPPRPVEFTEQFTEEETMAAWSRPSGSWHAAPEQDGTVWHRGMFCGDAWLTVDARLVGSGDSPLRLILAGDGRSAASGYGAVIARDPKGEPNRLLSLEIAGQPAAQASVDLSDADNLRFVRRGRFIGLYADARYLIGTFDQRPQAEAGRSVGIQRQGGRVDLDRVEAGTPNGYDTTFVTAPTAWHVGKGTWETTNRWKCDPRWSFFGGYLDMHPLIWTKADYGGDQQIEAYMAIKMKARDGENRYENASDLCVVLCGDGRDVTSGYALMFAAENNTCALLLKNGKVIGRNDSRDSYFTHIATDDEGTRNFHRHWFHLVLRKAGGRLLAVVDDKVLFDVEDPDPIDSGKAALYTVQNGVMVSRAKLWYEREPAPTPFVDTGALLAAANHGTADEAQTYANDFERGIGQFSGLNPLHPVLISREREAAAGQFGLAISNLVTGGEFGVMAVSDDFRLGDRPRLRFRYKVPPNVALNAYVRARDRWYQLRFTGGEERPAGYRALGDLQARADDTWRAVEFDLAAAFAAAGENEDLTIQRIIFGMLDPVPYRHAGMGVNPQLATWWLDDFSVGP